jgi:O-antigen/teichoic acid export membrane protein
MERPFALGRCVRDNMTTASTSGPETCDAVGGFCLDGLKQPASSFKISLLSALVLAALVVPLTLMFGVKGTAAAVIASAVLPMPLMLKLMDGAREKLE